MTGTKRTAIMRPRECVTCKGEFLSRSSKKKFCDPCKLERDRTADRELKARQARVAGRREVGGTYPCKDCTQPFVIERGPQLRCSACRATYQNRWHRHRRGADPKRSVTERIQRGINSCLGPGQKRWRSWETLVGYSLEELMAHLERQFAKGMGWHNRSEWHIDHIRPVSSFNFERAEDLEFKACWALTNLRPIWAKENRLKSDKILVLI